MAAAEEGGGGSGMVVIRDKGEMRSWSRSRRVAGGGLALVPTMGYLHRGHLSLVEEAKRRARFTVVSIYVNPGQFAPTEDLDSYPTDLQGDLRRLAEMGVDAVFCPANLYDYGESGGVVGGGEREILAGAGRTGGGDVGRERKLVSCVEDRGGEGAGHETWIRVERLEKGLCGRSRPVFFRGVATIVAKLFNIVEPDVAVFGKKDYQQWRIIRRMVRAPIPLPSLPGFLVTLSCTSTLFLDFLGHCPFSFFPLQIFEMGLWRKEIQGAIFSMHLIFYERVIRSA